MPSLVEIGPVVLEKKMKMWKVYDDDDDNDNDEGQRTNFDQKSSLEPSAQVSEKSSTKQRKHIYQTWQINSLGIDLFQFWRKPKEENNDTDDFLKYTS